MNLMTQEQAWAALDALETEKFYAVANRLALAMLERERNSMTQDLLTLVAARAAWMQPGCSSVSYQQLIEQACKSSSSDVAASARLWREAVSAPQSSEALLLANQIWTTLWVDLDSVRGGAAMAQIISSAGQRVYEREMKSEKTPELKERTLGRLAAVIGRAAFHASDQAQVKWALDAAERLTYADREDKLYPRYIFALQLFSHNDYDGAIEEFGKALFSGVPCDTAANAGCYMAQCSFLKNDKVGALAALEMTAKLYGDRQRIMRKAKPMRERYSHLLGLDQEQEVSRYIEQHYQVRLERALAQKARLGSTRELALN